MSDTDNAANAAPIKPTDDEAAKAQAAKELELQAQNGGAGADESKPKADGEGDDTKKPVPDQPVQVATPPVANAVGDLAKPNQTSAAQEAVEDDISLIPSAAEILDPEVATAAELDPSQRATPENVEKAFGPSEAELIDAQHSSTSPKPVEAVTEMIQPADDEVPHPTLPHVFAAIGKVYNDAIALGQSLESHVKTLETEGEAEMHAIASRMKALVDDLKTGVETIEAQMSARVKAAIEAMQRF